MRKKYDRRKKHNAEGGISFDSSYSDMMSALLLVFALVLFCSMLISRNSLEKQEQEYLAQKEELNKKEQDYEDLKEQVEEQAEKINALLGMKKEIIADLADAFEDTSLNIKVDKQTGAITLDSNLLFDKKKFKLKSGGKKYLNSFLKRYCNVLLKDKYKDYIAEIIIEGHTDPDGTYLYNMKLSQNRAYAVANYSLTNKKVLSKQMRKRLKALLTINGRSENDLIYKKDGKVDKKSSRRVEIKFRLKDDEMIEELAEMLG